MLTAHGLGPVHVTALTEELPQFPGPDGQRRRRGLACTREYDRTQANRPQAAQV
jgi:hypothetical protein